MPWGSAITPTAFARRTSARSSSPSAPSASAIWPIVAPNAAASSASASIRIDRVPSVISSPTHTPRRSAAARARRSACSGSNRSSAASTRATTRAVPILCANPTTCASTHPAASTDRHRVRCATSRARHAGSVPVATAAHNRGSRCRSSNASPTSSCPAAVDRPSAEASSAAANSATSGVPGPANRIDRSIPATRTRSGDPSPAGTGCRSAQCAANPNSSASAASAARRRATARSTTAAGSSPSRVSNMCSILEPTTDSFPGTDDKDARTRCTARAPRRADAPTDAEGRPSTCSAALRRMRSPASPQTRREDRRTVSSAGSAPPGTCAPRPCRATHRLPRSPRPASRRPGSAAR